MWECVFYQNRQKKLSFLVFGHFNPFGASQTTFEVLHRDQHKIWDCIKKIQSPDQTVSEVFSPYFEVGTTCTEQREDFASQNHDFSNQLG